MKDLAESVALAIAKADGWVISLEEGETLADCGNPRALGHLAQARAAVQVMNDAITRVADSLWEHAEGLPEGKERLLNESVASFLSCLAEDITNPEYAADRKDGTISGLIAGIRSEAASKRRGAP